MTHKRPLPPVWVMGIPYLTFGLNGGFVVVTLPQMLAAQGISGGHIAMAVAAITSPGFWVFMLAPMLDVWLSRRTYALIFGPLAAVAGAFTILDHHSVAEVIAVMITGYLAVILYASALGGWTGSLIDKHQDSQLGAWSTVANIGGGGLMVTVADPIIRHYPPVFSAILFGGALLLPMLSFFVIPSPLTETYRAMESFGRFWREAAALLKRREVQVALVLFALPSASFSLTNVLGGIGHNFHASPGIVSIFAGVGGIAAGIAGSLLVPVAAKKFPLRPLYLGIGIVGACFTLSILLLPRAPWTFGLAFTGESIFQAAAFSAGFAIIFEVIGPENPLAATIYALLAAAMNLPVIYMEIIDGHGYNWHGVTGAFLADALLSGGVCVLLWLVLFRWLRGNQPRQSAVEAK